MCCLFLLFFGVDVLFLLVFFGVFVCFLMFVIKWIYIFGFCLCSFTWVFASYLIMPGNVGFHGILSF